MLFLMQLLRLPINLIMAPIHFFGDNFNESGRSRSMFLGVPAVLLALAGVSAFCWAEFFSRKGFEEKYSTWAEQCSDEKSSLFSKIRSEYRLKQQANNQAFNQESFTLSEDDERVKELKALHEKEFLYLEKLISLNPINEDYRYRLALVSQTQGEVARCRSLMESIAGLEEPGNAKAHIWRANDLLTRRVSNEQQAKANIRDALKHADNCLIRDPENIEAKMIRARLLSSSGQYLDSFKEFDSLFAKEPRFYKQLIVLNNLLGRSGENDTIIETAEVRFRERIEEAVNDDYSPNWSTCWANYVECMHTRKDYSQAVSDLAEEEGRQNELKQLAENSGEASADIAARHVFIKQLLTHTYTVWANSLGVAGEISIQKERQQLDLLKKALSFDLQHPDALKLVARISTGDSELAAEARGIYDPEKFQGNAPASVLNEMGTRALSKKEYNKAIRYFEWAKDKNPNDPTILNNLAWTYLECENQKPDRALSHVNQAIRSLQNIQDEGERTELASHFFDTRGRALLQMGRKIEASQAFESALEYRPENALIIRSLIQCYRGSDEDQVRVLENRLKTIEQQGDTGAAAAGAGSAVSSSGG